MIGYVIFAANDANLKMLIAVCKGKMKGGGNKTTFHTWIHFLQTKWAVLVVIIGYTATAPVD